MAKHRLELSEGSSNKFWEITSSRSEYTVTWGRIGTVGQSKTTKSMTALDDAAKLLVEKLRKGYKPVRAAKGKVAATTKAPATAKAPAKAKAPGKAKATATVVGRKQLDAVFDELNRRNIVALQDAGLTISDGWSDCNEQADGMRHSGITARGAVFYHRQDTARAKKGQGLYLVFGAYGDLTRKQHEKASIAIAREVVELLEAQGFTPAWNGSVDQRIHTGTFRW